MICAWQEFIRLIPHRLQKEVDRLGKTDLLELRLRLGQHPILVLQKETVTMNLIVTEDDLKFIINAASQYSPWAAATVAKGYITAFGGHRIGICGECVIHGGTVSGVRIPTSLCIRVARDFPGIASGAAHHTGSVLIIGPPGSGKTTLLRDLIRQRSKIGKGSIAVVDERMELFPHTRQATCFDTGANTDVMTGCSKKLGIDMLLRTMGPCCIAVDEITEESDCGALVCAGWSGVELLATAHAASLKDLLTRPVYQPLVKTGLFQTILVLHPDKSWHTERTGL